MHLIVRALLSMLSTLRVDSEVSGSVRKELTRCGVLGTVVTSPDIELHNGYMKKVMRGELRQSICHVSLSTVPDLRALFEIKF